MHYSFEGKNALVTGSSKGIGRAVAIELARGGANVTINCSSSRTAAEEVKGQIEKLGRKCHIAVCDVSDQEAVNAMVQQTVDQFGSLDLFVSNAAYSDRQLMIEADMKGFRKTIDICMWGALYGVMAAGKQRSNKVKEARLPSSARRMARSLSYRHGLQHGQGCHRPYGTHCCHRTREVWYPCQHLPSRLDRYPRRTQVLHGRTAKTRCRRVAALKRLGTSEEMAHGIAFTLSEQAAYMVGSTITMDGGVELPWWSKRTEGGQ